MSGSSKSKGNKQSSQRRASLPLLAIQSTRFQRPYQWFLGIATLVGLAASVIFFFPRMTVTPDGLLDASNPYPISFTIMNTNVIPLHKLLVAHSPQAIIFIQIPRTYFAEITSAVSGDVADTMPTTSLYSLNTGEPL